MKMQSVLALSMLAIVLILPMIGFSLEVEDARTTGCLPRETGDTPASVCVSCHKDAQKQFSANQSRQCTTYCMSCHKKAEMDRHHTVGTVLPKAPEDTMYLTSEKKTACSTCHDLSQPRYDSVRWKATSLFDRMFHNESRYKTYFLSMKNDQGQLCLSCH